MAQAGESYISSMPVEERRMFYGALTTFHDLILLIDYDEDLLQVVYKGPRLGTTRLLEDGSCSDVGEASQSIKEHYVNPEDLDLVDSFLDPKAPFSICHDQNADGRWVDARLLFDECEWRWSRIRAVRMGAGSSDEPSNRFLLGIMDASSFRDAGMELSEMRSKELHVRQMEQVLSVVPAGIAFFSVEDGLNILYANDRIYDLFGVAHGDEEALRKRMTLMAQDDPGFEESLLNIVPGANKGAPWTRTLQIQREGAPAFWARLNITAEPAVADSPVRYCCFVVDVTQQVLTERAFNRQKDLYRMVMDDVEEIIFEYDIAADTMHLYNARGLSRHAFEVTTNFLAYLRRGLLVSPEYVEGFISALTPKEEFKGTRTYDCLGDVIGNEIRWWRNTYKMIADENGVPQRVIGLVREITEEQHLRERLEREHELACDFEVQASLDPMTRVLNRGALRKRVDNSLKDHERGTFFMMDLDDFKGVNDRLGHQAGDLLLQTLANRLKELFREGDIIGRLGGDEFVVYLPGVNQYSNAATRAEALIAAMEEIAHSVSGDCNTGVSIGIAMAPTDGLSFQMLYASADNALYEAKAQGRNRFVFA